MTDICQIERKEKENPPYILNESGRLVSYSNLSHNLHTLTFRSLPTTYVLYITFKQILTFTVSTITLVSTEATTDIWPFSVATQCIRITVVIFRAGTFIYVCDKTKDRYGYWNWAMFRWDNKGGWFPQNINNNKDNNNNNSNNINFSFAISLLFNFLWLTEIVRQKFPLRVHIFLCPV